MKFISYSISRHLRASFLTTAKNSQVFFLTFKHVHNKFRMSQKIQYLKRELFLLAMHSESLMQ